MSEDAAVAIAELKVKLENATESLDSVKADKGDIEKRLKRVELILYVVAGVGTALGLTSAWMVAAVNDARTTASTLIEQLDTAKEEAISEVNASVKTSFNEVSDKRLVEQRKERIEADKKIRDIIGVFITQAKNNPQDGNGANGWWQKSFYDSSTLQKYNELGSLIDQKE